MKNVMSCLKTCFKSSGSGKTQGAATLAAVTALSLSAQQGEQKSSSGQKNGFSTTTGGSDAETPVARQKLGRRLSETLFTNKEHAELYLKHRPNYPDSLYDLLLQQLEKTETRKTPDPNAGKQDAGAPGAGDPSGAKYASKVDVGGGEVNVEERLEGLKIDDAVTGTQAAGPMGNNRDQGASMEPLQYSKNRIVWDVACGSGQATSQLARRFGTIIGTDVSSKQVAAASQAEQLRMDGREAEVREAKESGIEIIQEPRGGCRFYTGDCTEFPSEEAGLVGSVDIITVATAAHWFDHCIPAFSEECFRVLKPDGIVAIWCYGRCRIEHTEEDERERFDADGEVPGEILNSVPGQDILLELVRNQEREAKRAAKEAERKAAAAARGESEEADPDFGPSGKDGRNSGRDSDDSQPIPVGRRTSLKVSAVLNKIAAQRKELPEPERRRRAVEAAIARTVNETVWGPGILGKYWQIQHKHVFHNAFSELCLTRPLLGEERGDGSKQKHAWELITSTSEELTMKLRSEAVLSGFRYKEVQAERLAQQCATLDQIDRIFVKSGNVIIGGETSPRDKAAALEQAMKNNLFERQNPLIQMPPLQDPEEEGNPDAPHGYIQSEIKIQKWLTLDDWLGYQRTWSPVQLAINETGRNPLEDELRPILEKLWGPDPKNRKKKVVWPLILRVWRKKGPE